MHNLQHKQLKMLLFSTLTCRDADMGGGERVIATLEHSDGRLDGGYRGRADAVKKCAQGIAQPQLETHNNPVGMDSHTGIPHTLP